MMSNSNFVSEKYFYSNPAARSANDGSRRSRLTREPNVCHKEAQKAQNQQKPFAIFVLLCGKKKDDLDAQSFHESR
jgi:hypothetical protein